MSLLRRLFKRTPAPRIIVEHRPAVELSQYVIELQQPDGRRSVYWLPLRDGGHVKSFVFRGEICEYMTEGPSAVRCAHRTARHLWRKRNDPSAKGTADERVDHRP